MGRTAPQETAFRTAALSPEDRAAWILCISDPNLKDSVYVVAEECVSLSRLSGGRWFHAAIPSSVRTVSKLTAAPNRYSAQELNWTYKGYLASTLTYEAQEDSATTSKIVECHGHTVKLYIFCSIAGESPESERCIDICVKAVQ